MKKKKLVSKISCERIYLKKHELDLAQAMFDGVDKDRKRLGEFLPWVETIKTVEDELDYINLALSRWEEASFFDYGLYLKKSDVYIGSIGVHTIKWENNNCELGYWIIGEFQGQGYISEGISFLEKYLFEEGFHRIQICCSSLNKRSAEVPKRCGYKYEGTLRENSIENGKYRNTQFYSKLSSD